MFVSGCFSGGWRELAKSLRIGDPAVMGYTLFDPYVLYTLCYSGKNKLNLISSLA
jgi:hypothetical protein